MEEANQLVASYQLKLRWKSERKKEMYTGLWRELQIYCDRSVGELHVKIYSDHESLNIQTQVQL